MQADILRAYEGKLLHYRVHHQNIYNWRIHCVSIPLEWLSWLIMLSYFQSAVPIAFAIAFYYLIIGSPKSCKAAITIVCLGYSSTFIQHVMPMKYAYAMAFIIQIAAWIVQVRIGHQHFEKNSPGMMKKLTINSVILSLLMVFEERIPM